MCPSDRPKAVALGHLHSLQAPEWTPVALPPPAVALVLLLPVVALPLPLLLQTPAVALVVLLPLTLVALVRFVASMCGEGPVREG